MEDYISGCFLSKVILREEEKIKSELIFSNDEQFIREILGYLLHPYIQS